MEGFVDEDVRLCIDKIEERQYNFWSKNFCSGFAIVYINDFMNSQFGLSSIEARCTIIEI